MSARVTRTPQVEEEVGDDLVQHPNVLLGEVAAVGRLGVRGEQAFAGFRGAARTPAVWDLGPAAHAEMVFMNELWFAVVPPPSAPQVFDVAAESVDKLVARRGII